ncbi:MAG: D-hexose-6-phosphate mutarotase [Pseudomonadota bacterium]
MPATTTTFGKLPAIAFSAPDGARAIVTLYGAHLVSWVDADGRERLFLSEKSALDGSRAIRGGVPVIFPQFAERGTGMRHGFARVCNWRFEDGAFHLSQADLPAAMAQAWPFEFELVFRVTLEERGLALTLEAHNSGSRAFTFASALHSYFLVDQLALARIDGVQDTPLAISDKFDQVFQHVAPALALHTGSATLTMEQTGFVDAVVWNPGAADAAALADMEDTEYQRFVCVEAALIDPPPLAAGASWAGTSRIKLSSIP